MQQTKENALALYCFRLLRSHLWEWKAAYASKEELRQEWET